MNLTVQKTNPVLKALAAFSKVAGPGQRHGRARRREIPQQLIIHESAKVKTITKNIRQ